MAVHRCVRRSETDNGMLFNLFGEVLNENLIVEVQRFRVYQISRDEFCAELFLLRLALINCAEHFGEVVTFMKFILGSDYIGIPMLHDLPVFDFIHSIIEIKLSYKLGC